MKSTICPDCGGDEFRPCAICYKAATKSHRPTESCHPAAEAYAKRHEMDVILSGHVDHESMTPDEFDLGYWKHRCRIFEVLHRAADGDLRDQMDITGRKEMELTKLRGEMRRTAQPIAQLITEGGAIVCTSDCSIIEIADATVTGRMFVDDNGFGFVRRTKEWLALQKKREASAKTP